MLHPGVDLGRWHGLGDAVALADIAAQAEQMACLFRRFNALGHQRTAEGV